MPPSIKVLCPAKVNLFLRVLGRRADGYHNLVTVMQPLSLADELTVTPGGDGIRLTCDHPDLPLGPENLVYRAALGFQEAAGVKVAAHLDLRKRIPVAAGLGGGSSDAAGALKALNQLYGFPLDGTQLQDLACGLGADVPFFLEQGPAVGRGTGTELSPLALPPYHYVLVNPGVPLSTRWVYENLDLDRINKEAALVAWDPEHPERWVKNDLGEVAIRRLPQLGELLERVRQAGALIQSVSGSGPTIFGLFTTWEQALEAAMTLRRSFQGWLAVTQGLTGRETDNTWESRVWTT
ncbi:MAG: 4-(cytidine 5'-diphospho)-2-C-methyl-D-erythritol kinase [Deltaproteobacteria bacterium]|nr:4-(cytidine 5'-diphospho)-2-C-methyl-D-erythritol kinase [Deltaproteobacteria bacterium]